MIAAQVNGEMADAITAWAAKTGTTQSDIIRTAISEFMQKYILEDVFDGVTSPRATSQPVIESPPTASAPLPQPAQADRYRGNGKSDHAALMALRDRQAARKKSGQAGERLLDTIHSRQGGRQTPDANDR